MLDRFFKYINAKLIQPIKDDWNSVTIEHTKTKTKKNRFISLAEEHNKRSQSSINRGFNAKTGKVIRAKTF